MNDNDIEKLKARKKKAESLPSEELEKYIESYIDICLKIDKKELKDHSHQAGLYAALCVIDGLKSTYGKMSEKMEEVVFDAVMNKDYERIYAISNYFEEMLRRRKKENNFH